MASRYFSEFKQKKLTAPKGPSTAPQGSTGEMPPKGPVSETTAAWPEAGPCGPAPFNKTTKWPVVKTSARKYGVS